MGKIDLAYLAATIIQQLAWTAIGLPILIFVYAQRNFDRSLMFDGAAPRFATVVAVGMCLTRILYVFPAITPGRHGGERTRFAG